MSITKQARLFGVVPQLAVDLALAAICFHVLYASITGYERSLAEYQYQLTQQLLFVAMLMSLPLLLLGGRPPDFGPDGRAWLAIIAVLVVTTELAGQGVAGEKLRLLFAYLAFAVALRGWLQRAGDAAVPAVLVAIGICHALVLLLVVQQAPTANPLQPHDQSWVPYHSHIRHVAYHGMVAACAGVALGFIHPLLRLPGLLLAAVALTGTFYFGARGALLGWLVFVVVFALGSRKARAVLLVAAVAAAAGIAFSALLDAQVVRTPFTGTLHGRVESVSTLVSSTGRTGIWRDALQAALQHPWFGHGLDGYRVSGCCMRGTVQPHNTLVQWLFEFGLIGTAILVWAFWRAFGSPLLRMLRNGGARPERAALLSIIAGWMAFALVDGLLYHPVPLLLFAILCALFYRSGDGAAVSRLAP